MLPSVVATVEYYEQLSEAFPDTESLTILIVADASRDAVARELKVDLGAPIEGNWIEDQKATAWALLEVPGGVLGVENTGYGDPTLAALKGLSRDNGAAAVVRHNIQAHLRFGCARNGELLFDDDEYMYIDDPDVVPAELRPLFDLAWDDLEGDEDDDEGADGFAVGLAMAELVTGVELNADSVTKVCHRQTFYRAPSLVYARSLE